MHPLAQIAWLRRVAEKAPAALGDDGERLAAGLANYFGASGAITLDAALGFSVGAGRAPWWVLERQQRRDDALRRLGCDLPFPKFVEELQRYGAINWPRDAALVEMPAHYRNTRRGDLFTVFQESGGVIPRRSRLREILAGAERGAFKWNSDDRFSDSKEIDPHESSDTTR